jgi:hypothetical protein
MSQRHRLSVSQTVVELVRRALRLRHEPELTRSSRTGLPVVSLGREVTSDDVRVMGDER